ncbi:MAG TPA: AI-2E family transporter [Pyrinomonadaceae bacterium]|jgi:predicted PurR-regulated permease PerM|nr:AI-2E family transporter [Pyrinomonadaceae bacterium]
MIEPEKPEIPASQKKAQIRERQSVARRVYLDPSSPSLRSIVRVVVVVLFLLFIASWVQAIISSLAALFFLIVLSVFFAYLIDPLVRAIRRPFKARGMERWMPRSLAILISYLAVFLILGFAIANIAPRVVEQGKEFGTSLPVYSTAIRERVRDLNQRFDRLRIPDEVQADMNTRLTEFGASVTASIGNFVLALATYLPWLLLVPILAFFFLKDVNQFRLLVLRMFPVGRWRYRAELVMADVNTTLAAYTRAQLISCLIIATICTIGFALIGLKYALLLGILAGIFEFVPLLGPITIGIVAILTAAASDHPTKALYVLIFLAVLRIIHDYITYPRIVRGGVHMHPLAIILSVLAGEQLAGIPGVFLSIPIVAVGTVLYRHVVDHRGRRGLVSGIIHEAESATEEIV